MTGQHAASGVKLLTRVSESIGIGVQPQCRTMAARRFNALARVASERESARTGEGLTLQSASGLQRVSIGSAEDDHGAPRRARGPSRHPAALSARLPRAMTGPAAPGSASRRTVLSAVLSSPAATSARRLALVSRSPLAAMTGQRTAARGSPLTRRRDRLLPCAPGGCGLRYAKSEQATLGRSARRTGCHAGRQERRRRDEPDDHVERRCGGASCHDGERAGTLVRRFALDFRN